MPLPTFKTKAEIPAGFEDVYEEREGAWQPKPVDDGAELKAALKKERDARAAADKLVKETGDERADLQRRLAALESGEDKDKSKKLLEKFDADLAKIKADAQAALDAANAKLRTLQLDDKAKAAMLKAGVLPTRVDALLKLKKESLDLEGDRIVIKNDQGDLTTETVEDYFAKSVKAEMPEWYAGTKATGGGASGGAGRSGAGTGKMSADDIVADPMAALRQANAEAA